MSGKYFFYYTLVLGVRIETTYTNFASGALQFANPQNSGGVVWPKLCHTLRHILQVHPLGSKTITTMAKKLSLAHTRTKVVKNCTSFWKIKCFKIWVRKKRCYKKWFTKLIFLNDSFFFNSVDFWNWKLTLKVPFWHFLMNRNSLTDLKNPFEYVDPW